MALPNTQATRFRRFAGAFSTLSRWRSRGSSAQPATATLTKLIKKLTEHVKVHEENGTTGHRMSRLPPSRCLAREHPLGQTSNYEYYSISIDLAFSSMQNKPSSSSQAKYPTATTLFKEYKNRKQKQKQKKLKLNRSLSYTKMFFFLTQGTSPSAHFGPVMNPDERFLCDGFALIISRAHGERVVIDWFPTHPKLRRISSVGRPSFV